MASQLGQARSAAPLESRFIAEFEAPELASRSAFSYGKIPDSAAAPYSAFPEENRSLRRTPRFAASLAGKTARAMHPRLA